jgi:hypothetical protein
VLGTSVLLWISFFFGVRRDIDRLARFGSERAACWIGRSPTSVGTRFRRRLPNLNCVERSRSRFAHQRWAIEYGGFREFDAGAEELLTASVRERTQGSISRPRLEQHTRDWSRRNSYLMPPARRLSDLVRSVIRDVTTEDRPVDQLAAAFRAALPARLCDQGHSRSLRDHDLRLQLQSRAHTGRAPLRGRRLGR